jgi:glycosyltransferase involved in cell wall biosynthesis
MNLGIDARPLAYGITGNSRYLAEALRIILQNRTSDSFYLFSNKPIHSVFHDLLKFQNVILVIEKKSIPGPIYLHCILPFRIKKYKIDKFWGTLQMLPFFKLGIPTFVNYHDLNFLSARETMAKWNYYQHKIFSPITLRNANKIFCLSKNTLNEISTHFPEAATKCTVIYPGVEKRKFKSVKNRFPAPYFLTIGTLEPRKNIQRLITAFQYFKKKSIRDKHTLLILGRKGWGEEGENLYQYLNSNTSKEQSVFFLENPSDDVLGQAIADCEAFFFPSLHEGFGLPLLEAMIENKRCIASDIPVFKEILEDKNDIYVQPMDTQDWEQAFHVASKFKTNQRRPKFSEQNWSWKKTALLLQKEIFG